MRNFVFIASHISVPTRVWTLDLAIQSILNQSLPADKVYIAISSEPEYTPDMNGVLSKFEANPCVTIMRAPVKLTQGEHIEKIIRENHENFMTDDLIHFCDDDDLYRPDRILDMHEFVLSNPNKQVYACRSSPMQDVTSREIHPRTHDFLGTSIFAENTTYFGVLFKFMHTYLHNQAKCLSNWDTAFLVFAKTMGRLDKSLCIQRKDMYNQINLDNITKTPKHTEDNIELHNIINKPGICCVIPDYDMEIIQKDC